MNDEIQKLILLRQSGELTASDEARLNEALTQPEHQDEAEFADFIFSAVKEDQPRAELSELSRERILASAVHALQAERPKPQFLGRWVAAAAAFIVMLTSLWFIQGPAPELNKNVQLASNTVEQSTQALSNDTETNIDSQLDEISSMLASLSEDFSSDIYSASSQEELSLEEIASELLSLQSEEI